MNHGNQYVSNKAVLRYWLHLARSWLDRGETAIARTILEDWRIAFGTIPASTRRRWRCGR